MSLIKWHYNRYLMFNRLKGDTTTVGDIITYESKKFAKHIAQTYSLILLRNADILLNRVK